MSVRKFKIKEDVMVAVKEVENCKYILIWYLQKRCFAKALFARHKIKDAFRLSGHLHRKQLA